MKKVSISISYDEERVKALNLYLEQREGRLEDELLKAVDALYTKIVPSNVREFIDLRSGTPTQPTKKKPRAAPSAVVARHPGSNEPSETGCVTNTDQPGTNCQRPLAVGGDHA